MHVHFNSPQISQSVVFLFITKGNKNIALPRGALALILYIFIAKILYAITVVFRRL